MKRLLLLLLFLALLLAGCQEDEHISGGKTESKVAFRSASASLPNLVDMRVLVFDESEVLVEQQRYTTSYPTTLRSPVGAHYFVFVVNAPQNTDIDTLQAGVAEMQNVLHRLYLHADGIEYEEPDEFLIYSTSQPVRLNQLSVLDVPLNRAVGKLQVALKAHAGMDEVYLDIVSPANAINFKGVPAAGAVTPGTRLRKKLTLNTVSGCFEGEIRAFPQQDVQVYFTVLYTEGPTESYQPNDVLDIKAGHITRLEADFTGNATLNISYIPWDNAYSMDYFAGFQVYVTVNGGNPFNYTGLSVQVRNNTTGAVLSGTDSIPLVYQNGKLSFRTSQLWGNGNFTLLSARLHDRDGKLYDPNNLGGALNLSFSIPGRVVVFALDGRQNEEEYHVRQVIKVLHGTLTAGSIFPGTTVYNTTRAIPLNLPIQSEGSLIAQWPTSLGALNGNRKNYNLYTIVQSGEYRLQKIDLATEPYSVTGLATGYTETRFKGKIPVNELEPFKYLNALDFARQDLPFGDITNWYKVKRLNQIFINNYGSQAVNLLSGSLPTALDRLDMQTFELFYTGLTGTLPATYSNWTNLVSIQLRYNTTLGGTLPASWGNFKKLTLMRLMNNNFNGQIPAAFAYYATINMAITLNSNYFICAPQALVDKYNLNIITQLNGNIGGCP